MTDYEPGWYLGILRDGSVERVSFDGVGWRDEYGNTVLRRDFTDVRPAVVLDSADEDVRRLAEIWGGSADLGAAVARQIAAQLPKPHVNPPEPTGRWAVVVDTDGESWLGTGAAPVRAREDYYWISAKGDCAVYADIKVKTIAFEGLS